MTAKRTFDAAIDRDQLAATIAAGGSLSGAVNVGVDTVVAIVMPAAWTAASLTFQAKGDDDDTFHDVYDEVGNELEVSADAGRFVALGPLIIYFAGAKQVKVRSGTASAPVVQGAERAVKVVTKPLSA